MTKVIELNNITKTYYIKEREIPVLRNLNVEFEIGKFYAIMGHSGSGKSTLISIIGLLENITTGEYKLDNRNVSDLKANEAADLRKSELGFIYQDFYLDDYLKAYENVMLPMLIDKKINKEERKNKALELLNMVDLTERFNHFPKEMSGGEKQRVAIARALANNPSIILADEPTGNLDEASENKIFSILKELSQKGKCVIVVSHSNEVKKYADVIYNLKDGRLEEM